MQVERCPSCGARYNVSRLRAGATFSCRRCTAKVLVGSAVAAAPAAAAPPRPRPPAVRVTGLWLAAAGLLTLLASLTIVNGSIGEQGLRAPWDAFDAGLVRGTETVAIALVGALAL